MREVGADEAVLFFGGRIELGHASVRDFAVIVVAPFGLSFPLYQTLLP